MRVDLIVIKIQSSNLQHEKRQPHARADISLRGGKHFSNHRSATSDGTDVTAGPHVAKAQGHPGSTFVWQA